MYGLTPAAIDRAMEAIKTMGSDEEIKKAGVSLFVVRMECFDHIKTNPEYNNLSSADVVEYQGKKYHIALSSSSIIKNE